MPPKKGQAKGNSQYKAGLQIKDILPPAEKNPPREGRPINLGEPVQQIPREVLFENFEEVEEWPGDEQAQNFDFGINGNAVFNETGSTSKDFLKIKNTDDTIIFWRRPNDYIKDEIEERVQVQQMMKIRRRQSFTSNQAFAFGHNSEDININSSPSKDDSLAYRKKDDVVGQYNTEEQQQQQQEPKKALQIKVFDIFEREETQQEMENRIKEQEQKALDTKKGAKKAPKKGEEQVEGPQKIKDAKLSNIDMSYQLLNDCKWVASQLQLVKDRNLRDVNTNKALQSKVYPQQDGVPVINPSGRYWVKLYFMGKERKIEIDDKMPVNVKGEIYYPKSVKKEEIWASLITKALFKLIMLTENISKNSSLTGSGQIMYALTGMLSQTIPVSLNQDNNESEQIQFIKSLLTDRSFNENDIFVTCYCNPDFNPQAESNLKREAKEYYIDQLKTEVKEENSDEEDDDGDNYNNNNQNDDNNEEIKQNNEGYSPRKKKNTIMNFIPETFDSPTKIKLRIAGNRDRKQSLNMKPTYVIPGFSYPVIEGFFNYQFNMVYVQKRSEKEVKLRQDYFELSKVTMHKFTKDEKLEHRRKKKELREKISECDRARVELITKPPIQYKLFRIKTNAARCPLLNIQCPFTNDEITIAKTCIMNTLSKPPNYELPEVRDDGKSMISAVKNQEETFVMRPLEDFSSVHNLKKSLHRGAGGNWVQYGDLVGCFQYFQIFYNPKKLENSQNILVKANQDQELNSNINNELLVIHPKTDAEGNQVEDDISEEIKIIFGFTPSNSKNKELDPSPFCILQQFKDIDQFITERDYPPLRLKQQSQLINVQNPAINQQQQEEQEDYQNEEGALQQQQNNQFPLVFKIMTYSPLSYMLSVACDNKFETMSIPQFLVDQRSYKLKQITVDYPQFEENKYTQLFRFRINPLEEDNVFLLKLNSTTDNNMLKYFRYQVLEEPHEGESYMVNNIEGVHKNNYQTSIAMQSYFRLSLKANTKYFILLEGSAPYNVAEGTLECDFYLKNEEQQIDRVEFVEPLEYTDKYHPTKYGILFREKLYCGEDIISSAFLRISNVEGAVAQQTDKKGAKKGEVAEIVEQPLKEQRMIKLELFEGDQLIQYTYGLNQLFLSSMILKANKNEAINYYLQASFDLRSWEDCKTVNEFTQNLQWFLKIQSSDTLAVVRDTVKEDREKAIIKSWEDKEPGRSAKSKSARHKFLVHQKQLNGEELNEEELALLKEPRLTRKQQEEEQGGAAGKGKKATKKDDKKQAKKGGKGAEVEVEVKEERPVPVSQNHRMNDIRTFLNHMEQERDIEELAQHQGLIDVRSEQNKNEIKENSLMSIEEINAILAKNKQLRQELQILQQEQKERILSDLEKEKQLQKEQWESYSSSREVIKGQLQEKNTKEKELFDICSQEKPTVTSEAFEQLIQSAKEIPDVNQKVIDLSYKVLKNVKIYALTEKFQNALAIFDVETLKACIAEFNEFSVTGIDSEIIESAESMCQEAAENPNFQAEKAAELKKAGKKGKK